jgi:hypothetical protein
VTPEEQIEAQRDVTRDDYADAVNLALGDTLGEKLDMERALDNLRDSLWELWRLAGGTDE